MVQIILHFLITYFVNGYRPLKTFIGLAQHPLSLQTPQVLEIDHHSILSANPVATLVLDDSVPAPESTSLPIPDASILANATFVMLCKNDELEGVVSSVRQLEDRFNRGYGYPWVFLNDQPFTEEFKERVAVLSDSPMHFGLVPSEQWNQPDWIDEGKALASRVKMMSQGIIYAGSVPYRNMCRFNSGFFYRHELMKPYRYYWRVEPNVKYFCDLGYDPFKFMQENNKVYGFTISLVEWVQTIPSLWETVKEFVGLHYEYLHPENSLNFLSNDNGTHYNLCHFWSNFEIGDMDFWRGDAYSKFFDYLEAKGGFYYERWGDAPVHSIAAIVMNPSNIVQLARSGTTVTVPAILERHSTNLYNLILHSIFGLGWCREVRMRLKLSQHLVGNNSVALLHIDHLLHHLHPLSSLSFAAGQSSKMMTPLRYVVLVLGIIISLHYILSFTHEGYGQATSLSNIKQKITSGGPHVPPYKVPLAEDYYLKPNITSPQGRKANATIVMLARNGDINGVTFSMKQLREQLGIRKITDYPVCFSLNRCVVNLLPPKDSQLRFSALHIRNLSDSVLLLPFNDGSALIHDIKNCVLVLGCHQFRMHTSTHVDVYLRIKSNPIIETCSNIRFGMYPAPLAPQLLQESPQPPFTVQDFSHIRATPSPNFSLIGEKLGNEIKPWPTEPVTEGEDLANILVGLLPETAPSP
ncbi:hypothetical protein NMY22_g886 [Coprinellus aureogranulatus]|nr:hypothetical protein NMY22_g886 [Coprinellus aureogranulatus]